jgi:hypothetical protein
MNAFAALCLSVAATVCLGRYPLIGYMALAAMKQTMFLLSMRIEGLKPQPFMNA